MKKQTLGMMIISCRKEKGMTQAELAEKMGVTDKAVSKWERDLSCPDINSLPKLAEIFEISVDDLMQIKKTGQIGDEKEIGSIIVLVCKAITIGMGVAVIVLSILEAIDMYSGFIMLGIGLTCIGITLFDNQEKNSV